MNSRRKFIKKISLGTGNLVMASSMLSFISCKNNVENTPQEKKEVHKKLGVALVGLGYYSETQLGPALKETKLCKLMGIVTGTPEKAERWKKEYQLEDKNIYNYTNFESIKDNKDIDIIYVVLPNAMHAEYVIKAAKAGKHVICEKPMAVTPKECEDMIQACKEANTMLSIGYRLHFEPFNQEMMRLGQKEVYGKVKSIQTENGFIFGGTNWRVNKALSGGGPLMDMGIYCVQAALYTTGLNPIAVTAKEGEKTDLTTFAEVEQSITWQLEFPNGMVANCHTTYGANISMLHAEAEKGWFELNPAFAYDNKKGKTSDGTMNIPEVFEQVNQMDDFAHCITSNVASKVPGEMGLRDMKIITAIYEAARTGQRIELSL